MDAAAGTGFVGRDVRGTGAITVVEVEGTAFATVSTFAAATGTGLGIDVDAGKAIGEGCCVTIEAVGVEAGEQFRGIECNFAKFAAAVLGSGGIGAGGTCRACTTTAGRPSDGCVEASAAAAAAAVVVVAALATAAPTG